MARKENSRRKPLTSSQKTYLYDKLTAAKEQGLEQETVLNSIAEELKCSPFTVRNIYNKEKRERKKRGLPEKRDGQIKSVQTELLEVTSQNSEPKSKLSITAETAIPKGASQETYYVEGSLLLDRLEKVIEERNEWKAKYEALEKDNTKLRERVVSFLIDN